jgi:hypothetical protein
MSQFTDIQVQELLVQISQQQLDAKLIQEKQVKAIEIMAQDSLNFKMETTARYQEQRKEDTQTLSRIEVQGVEIRSQNVEIRSQNVEIRSQNVEIRSQNVEIIAKVKVLEAKLEKIEANTVQIRDILLSEFQSIDSQLKVEMINSADFGLSQAEVVEQIENIKAGTPVVVVRNGKRRAKQYPTISALQAFAAFFGVVVKEDYRKEQGKFSARVMRQLTGVDFGGKYPAAFEEFLAHVGFYYQTSYVQPVSVKQVEQKAVST